MPGRFILTLSAAVLFACGAIATFAAEEVAHLIDPGASASFPVVVQLAAAGFLGFAVLNWMSRKNRIGGIYARPLGLGNLLLFATAALALGNAVAAGQLRSESSALCAIFAVLATGFAWLIFMHDPLGDQQG